MAESFVAKDRVGNELRWEDGVFTTNWGPYLVAINDILATSAYISGFSTGPVTKPGSTPGWVALFTAKEALRLDELDWDDSNVHYPPDVFTLPDGWVA